MSWIIWLAIGLLFLIIEIMSAGFLFLSFVIGAIVTGLFARLFPSLPAQVIIFSITTIITFLFMKRFANFLLKPAEVSPSNVDALIGQTGKVTRIIEPDKKGYVKVASEEWSAISENQNDTIQVGELVKIIRLEGNKVVVSK